MRFAAQDLYSADQQPICKVVQGTDLSARLALLPAAGTPIQTDAKTARLVTNITDARLRLDEVLQCMMSQECNVMRESG